jgi:hypothetical protein
MALTKAKQELVMKISSAGLEFTINRTDIAGLVHKAWKASIAREETNKLGPKALNYSALTHPETKQGHHKLFVLNSWKTQVNRRFEPIQNCSPQDAIENLRKLKATDKETDEPAAIGE